MSLHRSLIVQACTCVNYHAQTRHRHLCYHSQITSPHHLRCRRHSIVSQAFIYAHYRVAVALRRVMHYPVLIQDVNAGSLLLPNFVRIGTVYHAHREVACTRTRSHHVIPNPCVLFAHRVTTPFLKKTRSQTLLSPSQRRTITRYEDAIMQSAIHGDVCVARQRWLQP